MASTADTSGLPRCVLDVRAQLGESPVWCAEEQALYWVDILAPSINRFDPASGRNRAWELPEAIGSFGLRAGGGAVLALKSGFHRFDFASGALEPIALPAIDLRRVRFNDGKVSPDGRFLAGTMDAELLSRPLGELWCLDPDGGCRRLAGELIVSNGLAWSVDGRRLYHSDSKGKVIYTWDYDARHGTIANQAVLARPDEAIGRPDGGATDVEGYYWSAGISAGVINRWAADGRLERRIHVPVPHPTCVCFGGPGLTTLYITTLSHTLGPAARELHPQSGGIFALEVGVAGVPVARFQG